MRHAAFLVSTLLAFAGAAQATDWPQGSWCEVQRQNKDGVNPVTVEYRLEANGDLIRREDGQVRSGRWQSAPEGLELDGEALSAIRHDRTGFTAHGGANEDRLFLAGPCIEPEAAFWLDLETAIRLARQGEVLERLSPPVLLNTRNDHSVWGQTPLSLAVLHGETAIVKALIAAGAKADLVTGAGQFPLLLAMKPGVPDEVGQALLAAGAPVDTADDHGRTALFWAAANRRFAMVARLLDAGADPLRRWTHPVDERVSTIASAVLGEPGLPASLAKRLVALEERAR